MQEPDVSLSLLQKHDMYKAKVEKAGDDSHQDIFLSRHLAQSML